MSEPGRSDRLSKQFVGEWSGRYPIGQGERHLLDTIGPEARRRGYFHKSEFMAVVKWKSSRSVTYADANTDRDVEEITRAALSTPEGINHRILTVLHGVQVRMASAILTVWDPDSYTVMDVRAIESLRTLNEAPAEWPVDPDYPRYVDYLGQCRQLADGLGVTLRDLDRALWEFSSEGGGGRPSTRA